ncbi:MAG: EAL domain-containing protein [Campylobacterales bacterium]|nr:EAL domain-containing protein [Campylobacterales bacterium]
MLLFSPNNFDHIIATYGIENSDLIMEQAIELLQLNCPSYANLFVLDCGEACIVLNEVDSEKAKYLTQQIQAFFYVVSIEFNKIKIKISFTVGIASGCNEEVYSRAKMALITAKQNHRKYEIFEKNKFLQSVISKNLYWIEKLEDVIENNGLKVYYQPIVNNETKKIEKFEALIRIFDDEKVIGPSNFLGLVKQAGLLSAITKFVINESFKMQKETSHEITINVTNDDFMDDSFINFVEQKLVAMQIDPNKITFEVSETITEYSDYIVEQVFKLKSMGFKIAVDDFGVEHSNFARVMHFEVDYIKIDGSFVKNIDTDKNSYIITKTIANFAKAIGAKCVAEFVSSEEIYEIIKELGIEYSQGYFFSEPLSSLNTTNNLL